MIWAHSVTDRMKASRNFQNEFSGPPHSLKARRGFGTSGDVRNLHRGSYRVEIAEILIQRSLGSVDSWRDCRNVDTGSCPLKAADEALGQGRS